MGNDDEEFFISTDGGATWTETDSLTVDQGDEGGFINDIDSYGTTTTNKLINGSQEFTLNANGSVTFPDGSIQTTAYTGTSGDQNVWVQTFESVEGAPADVVVAALSVEYDVEGNLICLFGHEEDVNSPFGGDSSYFSVAKIATTGTILWQKRFAANFRTDGWGLAVNSNDGSVYIAGSDVPDNETFDSNAILTKIDLADGDLVWSKIYQVAGTDGQSPVVDIDLDGNPVMVGYYQDGSIGYIATTVVNSVNGSVIWSRKFDGQGYEYAYGMGVGPNGEVVTVGYTTQYTNVVDSYSVTPQTGSGVEVLVINRSDLSNDTFTTSWKVAGSGISEYADVTFINSYSGLTSTVQQGSGATFNVTIAGDGSITNPVTIANGGSNYLVGHKIKIPYTAIGGADLNSDIILTVTGVDSGSINAVAAGFYGGGAGTPNTYGAVAGTNYQTGSGLVFALALDDGSTYTEHPANITVAGTNYVNGDVVVIPGTQLGGTSPANDLTATVSVTDGGAVTGFNTFSGTQQTTTYRILVSESEVDFSADGNWTLNTVDVDENDRMLVVKYNSLGAIQWQKAIQFDDGYDCQGADCDIDSAGNIYVTGQYDKTDEPGVALSILKLNSSGVKQWSRRVTGNCDTFGTSIVVGADNNLYLSGITGIENPNENGAPYADTHSVLAKYSTDGTVLWQRLLENSSSWSFTGALFEIGGSNLAVKDGYVAVSGGYGDFDNFIISASVAQVSADGTTFSVGEWDFVASNFSGTFFDNASDLTVVNAGKIDTDFSGDITVTDGATMDLSGSTFLIGTVYREGGADERLINGANQLVLESNGTVTLPSGGTISEGVVTSNPTIQLTPASPDVASQKLVIKGGGGEFYNQENGIGLGTNNNVWEVTDSATFYVYAPTRPDETLYWWIVPEEGGISTTMSGTVELNGNGDGVFNFTVISDAYEFRVRVSPEENNYDPANVGVQSVLMNSDAPAYGDYHLHLTTGDLTETSIFLGTDDQNVRTTTDGKIQITTPSEGNNVWEFDTDGSLTFPDNTVQTTAYTAPNLAFTGYIDYNTDSDDAATFTVVRSSKPLNAIKEIQINPEILDIALDPMSVRSQLEKIVNTPRESKLTLTLASDTTKVWNYAVTHIGRTGDTSSYKEYRARFIRTYSDNASGIIRMVITKGGISQKYWDPLAANDDWYVGIGNSSSILAFTIADSTAWIRRDYEQLVKFFESVVDNVIYNGVTEITDAEQLRTRFYANADTLISNMGGNLYYNFRAYNSSRAFNNVPLTSVSSTVNAEITFDVTNVGRYQADGIDASGAGFQVGQQITLLGSSLGDYSEDPADQLDSVHNATVTVTAVDGSGGITEYTVSGYGVAIWRTSDIDDGEDDQFDGSNKFTTNISWTNNRSSFLQYNSGLVTTGSNADNFFGSGSKYVIAFHKGIVMLAATGVSNSVEWFAITGNSGFDEDGTVDEGAVNIGTQYSLYVRCVSGPEYLPQVEERYLVSMETTDRYGLIEVINNLGDQESPSNHIILQSLHEGDFTVKGNDELILTANMEVTIRGGNGSIGPSGSSRIDGRDVRIYGGAGFENGGDTTKFGEGGDVIIQGGNGNGYAYTISAMTNASPTVVTVNRPLELPSGMLARFGDMSGLSLSDTVVYYVSQTSATELTIYTDSDRSIPLDTTGLGSFVSGNIILGKRDGAVNISSLGSFDGNLKLNQFVWPTNYTEASAGQYLKVKSIEGSTPYLEFANDTTTVAKTGVLNDVGIPSILGGGMTGLGIADGTYGPFTRGGVTFEVTVSSGSISGYINISSTTSYAVNDTIGQLTSGDLGDTPGQTTTINVDAVDQGFTAIDLTKTINKLTDGNYTLADGVEGQIMYLVRSPETDSEIVIVVVENADGINPLRPFMTNGGFANIDNTGICTLIFTDGTWKQTGGLWD
jgi:hypothetical protein